MITAGSQRWKKKRSIFRPPRDTINTRDYFVEPIDGEGSDSLAKGFIEDHHYSGSYVNARFRFGLYHKSGELQGVAVFSVPQSEAVLKPYPGDKEEKVELGRFVLLNEVPFDGETWMLARCFEQLERESIRSILSFSDPVPRTDASSKEVFGGHIGQIYQAHNAEYLGLTKVETKLLLASGRTLCGRTLSKIRAGHQGRNYVRERLIEAGAPTIDKDDPKLLAWLERWLPRLTRPFRHTGNHRYLWCLGRRARKELGRRQDAGLVRPSLPYPKIAA